MKFWSNSSVESEIDAIIKSAMPDGGCGDCPTCLAVAALATLRVVLPLEDDEEARKTARYMIHLVSQRAEQSAQEQAQATMGGVLVVSDGNVIPLRRDQVLNSSTPDDVA